MSSTSSACRGPRLAASTPALTAPSPWTPAASATVRVTSDSSRAETQLGEDDVRAGSRSGSRRAGTGARRPARGSTCPPRPGRDRHHAMTVQQVGNPSQVGCPAHQPAPRRRQRRPPAAGHRAGSTGSASIFRRKADASSPGSTPSSRSNTSAIRSSDRSASWRRPSCSRLCTTPRWASSSRVLRDELLPPAGRPQQVEPA